MGVKCSAKVRRSEGDELGIIRGHFSEFELMSLGRSSTLGKVENFKFSILFRPTLGSAQTPIQWVQEPLSSGVKRAGT
jgi:hypothetical protein